MSRYVSSNQFITSFGLIYSTSADCDKYNRDQSPTGSARGKGRAYSPRIDDDNNNQFPTGQLYNPTTFGYTSLPPSLLRKS